MAEQPFYHMLPDQLDCEKMLGGARDLRYVAEVPTWALLTLTRAHLDLDPDLDVLTLNTG